MVAFFSFPPLTPEQWKSKRGKNVFIPTSLFKLILIIPGGPDLELVKLENTHHHKTSTPSFFFVLRSFFLEKALSRDIMETDAAMFFLIFHPCFLCHKKIPHQATQTVILFFSLFVFRC